MNILVIESSSHKVSSSNMLAEQFIRGAKEAGNNVTVFDAGHAKIHPCLGCGVCGMTKPCCQKDDMAEIREKLLSTDMVVFVTPLYYYSISAQLKTVIDRFYSFNGELTDKGLKTVLIVASWDSEDDTMRNITSYYKTLCNYLNFNDKGQVLGTGCGTPDVTKNSPFLQEAYELGKLAGK